MPIDQIITSSIADGAVVPADLSTGAPTWDASGNLTVPGRLQTTLQPAFSARMAATTTLSSGVQQVLFNTESFDRAGNFTPGNGRFTAPVAGIYLFNVCIAIDAGTNNLAYVSAELYLNGVRTLIGGWSSKTGATSGYAKATSSFLVQLAANDYVTAGTEVNYAASMLGGATQSYFNGYLVA